MVGDTLPLAAMLRSLSRNDWDARLRDSSNALGRRNTATRRDINLRTEGAFTDHHPA